MTIEKAAEENEVNEKNIPQRRAPLSIHETHMRITDGVQQQTGIYTGSYHSKTQKPHDEGQII